MKWRAWCSGGRLFDSSTVSWNDLPGGGCLGFVVYGDDKPYRDIVTGDWFTMGTDGRVQAVAQHDEWGQWAPRPVTPHPVIQGVGVSGAEWERVQAEMLAASEAP